MTSHRWAWVLLVLVALGLPWGADAANVLVFNSTRFVDSGQGSAYPVGSQESDNVQDALRGLGHTVDTIAGDNDPTGLCSFGNHQPGTVLATAAEYQAALANADVFHIPEQESYCYLPGELQGHPDIVAVWRTWVAGGGGLVIHSSREAMVKVADLLDVVFGFHGVGGVDGTDITTTKRATAQGTLFAGGPATLPGNESTGVIPLSTLPAGSVSIYDDGTNAAVAIIPFGAGKIVFLGWDWTYSEPAFPGHLNGGWYPLVLDGAVREAASKALTVTLSGTGSGAVGSATPAFDSPLSCQPTCRAHYRRGAEVQLTATPAAGSVFQGWSGGGCTGTAACTVTLAADTVVTAMFDSGAGGGVGLTVTEAGSGAGTVVSAPSGIACAPDCFEAFPDAMTVTLTATPAAGSFFAGWSGSGCPGVGPCVVTVDDTHRLVTAAFEAFPSNLVTAAVNQPRYSAGDRLVVSVGVNNPGLPAMADLYCGLLLPDGETIVFFTDVAGGIVFGRVSAPGTFRPIAAAMTLTNPLSVTASDLFEYTWTGSEPRGRYMFFMAAFAAGSLADGAVDRGDLLAYGIAPFDFAPD
jgi:hypothetical protein